MSSLFRSKPEYDVEAAESAPLVNREDDDFSAFRSGDDGDRVNVTYVFAPEWPVPGREEQIVGVLGRDKDVRPCSRGLGLGPEHKLTV
jgi:hypothetical protein